MTHSRIADLFREHPKAGVCELTHGRAMHWLLPWPKPVWAEDGQSFEALLARRYQRLVRVTLSTDELVCVPAFAHGGISSGHIGPSFCSGTALPLLLARFHRASASH